MLDGSSNTWGFPDMSRDNLHMSNMMLDFTRSASCPLFSFADPEKSKIALKAKTFQCSICPKSFSRLKGL
jgi:hypothetical protein